ncbi:MAG: sensor histidine kinase [Mangrovibacterium sp.]
MKKETKQRYNRLFSEKAWLEQQNQLKDKLFHVIGYDLRSMVGSLQTILSFWDEGAISPESSDFRIILSELSDVADDAYYLLENVVYWDRIQSDRISCNPDHLQVKPFVDQSIARIRRNFDKKGIGIVNRIQGDQLVWVDEYLFPVIMRNLLSNACKFSTRGSEVLVSVSEAPGQITIHLDDQGVGIKEENLKKIQDPYNLFFTYGTDNENGNGLGLKICEALAKINRGQLLIRSQEGKGTAVNLVLPQENSRPEP